MASVVYSEKTKGKGDLTMHPNAWYLVIGFVGTSAGIAFLSLMFLAFAPSKVYRWLGNRRSWRRGERLWLEEKE